MTASLRNLLAASILLLSPAWATNPPGTTYTTGCDCPPCSDGGSSSGATSGGSGSFNWSINVGLARYPKPASFTDLGQAAYEKNGLLPTFSDMFTRYFPKSPLQQAQIRMEISQVQISAATFHPSCLFIQSEANFQKVTKPAAGGYPEYIYQVITDDVFTVIELLDPNHPGNGFRVRVWKRNAAALNQLNDNSGYYDVGPFNNYPTVTPLTDVTFAPDTSTYVPNFNTLFITLKETMGISGSRITTQQTVQTLDASQKVANLTTCIYSDVGTGGPLLSKEVLNYTQGTAPHNRPWDYTLTRQVQTASMNAAGTPGGLYLTRSTQEVYQDFSTSVAGGDMGMKRLMSLTEAYPVSGGVPITDNSSPQTTSYTYVQDDPANTVTYGRLQSVVNPDGSWMTYSYTASVASPITIIKESSGWKDGAMGDANNTVTKTTTVNGGTATELTTVGSSSVISQSSTTLGSADDGTTTIQVGQYDGANWHYTTTGYYPETATAPNTGRIKWIENADGTASTYTYGSDSVGNLTTTASTGAGNRNGITDGTKVYSILGVGNFIIQQTTTDIATNLVTESWITDLSYNGTLGGFDIMGRPVKRIFNSDLTDYDIKIYACCGLLYSRERDGSSITYTRDGLKRVCQEAKKASDASSFPVVNTLITINGLSTSKSRMVSLSSQQSSATQFLGSTTRSLDGLTVTETGPSLKSANSADRPVTTTATTHNNGTGDTVTTTYADDSITVRSSYLDGRASALSGTAVAPVSYDYGTWSGGTTSTTNASGVTTTISADMLGRTYQQVSTATGTTTYTYYPLTGTATESPAGARGRLKTLTDGDNVATTYGYNNKGERTTTSRTVPTGNSTAIQVNSVVNDVVSGCPQVANLGACLHRNTSISSVGGTSVTVSDTYLTLDGLTKVSVVPSGQSTVAVTTQMTTRPGNNGVYTITTTNPDGTRDVQTYTHGLPTQTAKYTSGNSPALISSTTNTYDDLQHLATSVDSRTGTTIYSNLAESGTPLTMTNAHGDATSYTCDKMGRVTQTTLPDNSVTYTSYDSAGRVAGQWGSQTYPTYREYDLQGRLTYLHTYKNLTTEPTPPSGTTDAARAADALSRNISTTIWTYGPTTGLLVSKTYAKADATTAAKSTNYTYSAAGRLSTRTWARGVVTTYVYTNGFLTSVNYSDNTTPNVAISYDALGRQSTVSNGIASSAFTYDPYTLVLSQETITYTLPGLSSFTRVLNRSRDSLLRDIGWQLKNGTTVENQAAYGYSTSDGRLSSVADANNSFNYGYVANSNLIGTVTGPVHTVTNTWEDHRDLLASKKNKVGTAVISEYDYTVNSMGQRTGVTTAYSLGEGVTSNAGSTSWGYDGLGQVISADAPGPDYDRAYQYDTIGNRKKSAPSLTLPASDNYSANALNQYTAIGGLLPVYDDDGNATAYPVPTAQGANSALTWDAENRMVSSTVGTTTTYLYDAQSRRVAKTTSTGSGSNAVTSATLFVYDGFNCIAEYTADTNTSAALSKTYLWGTDLSGTLQGAGGVGGLLSVSSGGASNFPTYDGNGNVSEYLSSSGSVSAHFEYDPFGNTVVNSDADAKLFPYRFSTKPLDFETGLYYYTYRYYDPATGRWPSRDPAAERGGTNLYGFMRNDGINKTDYLGLVLFSLPGLGQPCNKGDADQWNGTVNNVKIDQGASKWNGGQSITVVGSWDVQGNVKEGVAYWTTCFWASGNNYWRFKNENSFTADFDHTEHNGSSVSVSLTYYWLRCTCDSPNKWTWKLMQKSDNSMNWKWINNQWKLDPH